MPTRIIKMKSQIGAIVTYSSKTVEVVNRETLEMPDGDILSADPFCLGNFNSVEDFIKTQELSGWSLIGNDVELEE